jgi:FMN phosphatase YigB (HAD superfamily)
LLAGAIVSSDARARKPDLRIYRRLLDQSGYRADELLFVDDRQRNVDAASAIGIRAVRFAGAEGFSRLAVEIARPVTPRPKGSGE